MAAAAEGFDSYYATLSISPTATDAEIKRAYRKAAIASHPDKGGDAEKFKAVAEAFEVLSDANKRAAYDRFGKAGLRGGGVAQRTSNLRAFEEASFPPYPASELAEEPFSLPPGFVDKDAPLSARKWSAAAPTA